MDRSMKKKDDDKLNHASHRRVEGESLVYEAGTRRRSPHSGGPWNFTVRSAPGGIRPTAWRSTVMSCVRWAGTTRPAHKRPGSAGRMRPSRRPGPEGSCSRALPSIRLALQALGDAGQAFRGHSEGALLGHKAGAHAADCRHPGSFRHRLDPHSARAVLGGSDLHPDG